MSTLGGMLRHASRRGMLGVISRRNRKSKPSGWLPRDEWEAKLKAEGKWKDYNNKD